MKALALKVNKLIRMQSVAWYLFLVLFSCTTVLITIDHPWSSTWSQLSVVIILLATIVRLVFLFEAFRRALLFRYALLTILLFFILISTVLIHHYLP